jgi:hypothetical protein
MSVVLPYRLSYREAFTMYRIVYLCYLHIVLASVLEITLILVPLYSYPKLLRTGKHFSL